MLATKYVPKNWITQSYNSYQIRFINKKQSWRTGAMENGLSHLRISYQIQIKNNFFDWLATFISVLA
jgi:hypothetical protein